MIGDPTEAALVVLAAKLGVDAEETRRAYPRLAEVPFDSEYKFMATFHRFPLDGVEHVIELVKGAPGRRARPLHAGRWPAERRRRCRSTQARAGHRGGQRADGREGSAGAGVRRPAGRADDELAAMTDDPMSLTHDLAFVGMVGIIDPLRAEAKERRRDRARGRHRRADDHR